MRERNFDYETILRVLARHGVKFIVVGGVCATFHGVTLPTFDLDVVHLRTPDNLAQLEEALTELSAYYREHPPHRILPEAQRMDTPGHHLLMTRAGAVDVLGTVASNRDYEQLLPHTLEITLGEGVQVRILDLPTLIQTKQAAGRDKDKLVLPILRQVLEEMERLQRDDNEGSASVQNSL
jgi:predicted nucleotidyltransferase